MIPTDWAIQAELHGVGNGWTTLTRDVLLSAGIKAGYGMRDNWPTGLRASVGQLLFSLNNSHSNSLATLGLYTIGQTMCRLGFTYGVRVRLLLGGTVRFLGRLDSAPATDGNYGPRDVRCRVADWMDEARKFTVRRIPAQANIRADEALQAIVDAMEVQPNATSFDQGSDVFPYAFDQAAGKGDAEMDAVVQSEMGRLYDLGGTLTLENRNRRRNRSAEFVLDHSPYIQFDAGNSYEREDVKTRVEVTAHPREVGTEEVVLYTLQDKTFIGPGQTRTLVVRYVDPDQRAASIGGADMVYPITDYTANTRADGLGTDMTASLDVSAEGDALGGRESTLILENTHGTSPLYVTSLMLWGIPVRDLEQAKAASVASQADLLKYGDNPITIDMKYQGSAAFAQAVADGVRAFMGTPRLWNGRFTFCANHNATLMQLALTADISTCFEYRSTISGSSNWFINAVDLEIDKNDHLWVTWYCEPADLTHYWMPGVDTLGVTTLPAPY